MASTAASEYDGGAVASGAKRNVNLTIQEQSVKISLEAYKQEPWGHNIRGDDTLTGPRPASWWTGKPPVHGVCPGVLPNGKITSLPLPNINPGGFTRQSIIDYFDNSWTLTEVLLSGLQGEPAFYRPPYHQLRHPFIFYYTHPAVLYINKMRLAGLMESSINPEFEQLFETGVDEMSWDDMSKNNELWPTVAECTEYRRVAYQRVLGVLETHPLLSGENGIGWKDDVWSVVMGFEHERIHLETSSVLMREFPVSLLRRPNEWPENFPSNPNPSPRPVAGQDFPVNEFLPIRGGDVQIGRGEHADSFGWDNEFGSTTLTVKDFSAGTFMCSNGEFWEFVRSGAYIERRHWTTDGWSWRQFRNAKWPTFWVADGPQGLHQYQLRCTFEIIPMPWSWPAVVNLHEAKAFCNWMGERLNKPFRILTEAEHRFLRDASCTDPRISSAERDPVLRHRGDEMVKRSKFPINSNLGFASESAVNGMSPASTGVFDSMGNVWMWCEDWLCPLEGFKVHRLYDDFSTPCFDNKHSVIMGGSFISTGNEASIHARFHFRPHFFQHAGFRVVFGDGAWSNAIPRPMTTDQFVRKQPIKNHLQRSCDQMVDLHFGAVDGILARALSLKNPTTFSFRLAELILSTCKTLNVPTKKALDLGCGVGGVSFHLSREFESILGIDLSEDFLAIANQLKGKESPVEFSFTEEGEVQRKVVAELPSCADTERVRFKLADVACLPPDTGNFNVVVLSEVLSHLPSPKGCLGRMGGRKGVVAPGGILVCLSSYDWNEESTPRDAWVGGFVSDKGDVTRSQDGIAESLGSEFQLAGEQDFPVFIRESSRSYRLAISHATIWQRNGLVN